jgi:hypothetical protein
MHKSRFSIEVERFEVLSEIKIAQEAAFGAEKMAENAVLVEEGVAALHVDDVVG